MIDGELHTSWSLLFDVAATEADAAQITLSFSHPVTPAALTIAHGGGYFDWTGASSP